MLFGVESKVMRFYFIYLLFLHLTHEKLLGEDIIHCTSVSCESELSDQQAYS